MDKTTFIIRIYNKVNVEQMKLKLAMIDLNVIGCNAGIDV
jgi:hypothetical protein